MLTKTVVQWVLVKTVFDHHPHRLDVAAGCEEQAGSDVWVALGCLFSLTFEVDGSYHSKAVTMLQAEVCWNPSSDCSSAVLVYQAILQMKF